MKTHRRSDPAATDTQQSAETSWSPESTDAASQAYALQSAYGNQYVAEMARAQSEGVDPLSKATPVTSLPGAANPASDVVGVAQHADVERRSEANAPGYGTTFEHMDSDYLLGFTLEDREVRMGFAGDTQRGKEKEHLKAAGGIDTLVEYRQMLVRDFNFNGILRKYTGTPSLSPAPSISARSKGMGAFLADVVARFYPDSKVGDPEAEACVAIARNIWSYATCGMDMGGDTNIEQLQGLLYVFDKEVRGSSETNTKMRSGEKADDWFVVPGTEDWDTPIKILKGDGRHGRATILTTRHLLTGMTTTTPEPGELGGYDRSYLLLDNSGSMRSDEFKQLSKLIDNQGIDGTVLMAAFNDNPTSLKKVKSGQALQPREAAKILSGETPDQSLHGHINSGHEEQGIATALKWLKEPTTPPAGSRTAQMVIVTDEPDFKPEKLADLQDAAKAKGYAIKVVYSFKSSTPIGTHGSADSDSYMVIDLLTLDPAGLASCEIEREGVTQLDWRRVGDLTGVEVKKW